MATMLPVRIDFRLPAGWVAAPPDEVGEPDMAFVALHPASIDDHFSANITVNGQLWSGPAPLTEIADRAVEGLRAAGSATRVEERREVGSPEAPGLMQVLKLRANLDGTHRRAIQTQVLLSFPDVDDPREVAVVKFALTTTPGQFPRLIGDFQEFVRSVRPA